MRPARALLALAILAALLPGARAQDLVVSATPLAAAQPVGPNITVPVGVSVPCSLLPNGSSQQGSVALLDAPTWLLAGDTANFTAGPCGADPQVAHANVTFRLTPDAPAGAVAHARLVARVREATAQLPFDVVAKAFAIVDVAADRSVAQGGPQSAITFPLHVRNLGNGLMRVTIDVGPLPDGWVVLKPQPLTLQARQSGGLVTEGTANVVVVTPHRFGYLDAVAQIPVWVNATLVGEANATDSANLTLTATAKGFDAPAPSGALALAPLAVAAWLVARRAR